MPEPIKPGEGDATPTVAELQSQIDNLNKGIATYRDDSQKSKAAVAEKEAEVAKLKTELEAAKKVKVKDDDDDSEVVLAPADQKKLEAWAKAQGFVTQKELEAEKAKIYGDSIKNIETQAIDEFLKTYPIYDKDEEWKKVEEQFALYKTPTSLSGYRQLLTKIHKDLNPGDDGEAKARADLETKRRLGLGGGNQRVEGEELTVESLQERYPRLSKSQIEARLAEIKALYPKK